MSFQRRLAIVPGSDMLSPKEAQRILAKHHFPDYPESQNRHQRHDWGPPKRSPSPENLRKSRLQMPPQHHDHYSSDEIIRHDEQPNGIIRRRRFKQDTGFKKTFGDAENGRKACDEGRLKSDSGGHANEKTQQLRGSPDDPRRYSTTGSEDISSVGEMASEGAKRHSNGDMFCRLAARNSFNGVGNSTKYFKNPC